MATESLNVPEQHLADVVRVIRAGLKAYPKSRRDENIHPKVRKRLDEWCDMEEEYLQHYEIEDEQQHGGVCANDECQMFTHEVGEPDDTFCPWCGEELEQ